MNTKQLQGLSLFLSSIEHQLRQAAENSHLILNFMNPIDRNNKKRVLEAIELDAFALRMASVSLCNDREVVMASIKKNGLSLIWASRALREDKQIVLEAIKNNFYAIRFASNNLLKDGEFIYLAYNLNSKILKYINKENIHQHKIFQNFKKKNES